MLGSTSVSNTLCVILLLLSTCSLYVSAQREVFVLCDNTATSTGAGTPTNPFKSIKAAVLALGPGGGIITTDPGGPCLAPDNTNILISHTNIRIRTKTGIPGALTLLSCGGTGARAFIVDNAQFVLERFLLTECGAPNVDGGAMFIKNAFVTLEDVTLAVNVASRGGGIYSEDATIQMKSTLPGAIVITVNSANQPRGGGGLYIKRTSVINNGVIISGNDNGDVRCDQGSFTGTPPPATAFCQSCYVQGPGGANTCAAV